MNTHRLAELLRKETQRRDQSSSNMAQTIEQQIGGLTADATFESFMDAISASSEAVADAVELDFLDAVAKHMETNSDMEVTGPMMDTLLGGIVESELLSIRQDSLAEVSRYGGTAMPREIAVAIHQATTYHSVRAIVEGCDLVLKLHGEASTNEQ